MEQLVYTSSASDDLGSGEVFKIIEKSAQNNAPAELTGFLIFANRRFFQVIEGPGESIDALMRRLGSDTRHHSIEIVLRQEIAERSFPDWRMKRVAMANGATSLSALAPEFANATEGVRRAADTFLKHPVS